ncbi:DUF6090 family protein [Seonamhaeicola sp. MEBiC1930]|uniref:DUF6090 family protein n=1 Tax=Seonamhaeicola sp. MEBiC01930 TaxID=2976768 RepID=UPI003246E5E0
MIKFFRNIRKKLLNEGNTSKYLKYAIGEIILVVIGILIALQINNWNEQRLKNQEIKSNLKSLIDDLNYDKEILTWSYNRQSFKFYSMQYLLKIEGTNPYNPIDDDKSEIPPYKPTDDWDKEIPKIYNKEFIQLAFLNTHKEGQFPFAKSALEELKSTGMFSNISPKLKAEINTYYENEKTAYNGKIVQLSMDWQASLAEDGYITANVKRLPDPIVLIKDNPKRIGLMNRMVKESAWALLSNILLKTRNAELIQLIEKEIETF